MKVLRASGILLHVTSLPGRWGVGDMGEGAYRFIDFLAESGQRYWQVLPLGPTGWGHSPYQCLSAFAGNPLWISLERLVGDGLLSASDLEGAPSFPEEGADYEGAMAVKGPLLRKSFWRLRSMTRGTLRGDWEIFRQEQAWWLDDWGLFMALKEVHSGVPWNRWEEGIARRQPASLNSASRRLADEILFHQYLQYQFFRQWQAIREYAHRRGIWFVGDVPIYVAHDSADVWSHPELFCLDGQGNPTLVAGVPPDYFSATGQRWGNPIYRWDAQERSGYRWWLHRFRAALAALDFAVLDHFRGFEGYWEVPASAATAVEGRWVKGPGAAFFEALQKGLELHQLPFIAEDLGVMTTAVEALRDHFGFPGMRVLQFAFDGDARNPHLPHNYPSNCVVYTGTHNNDTAAGWFSGITDPGQRELVLRYLGLKANVEQIHWHLVRLAMASVANMAVFPLQDILGLDSRSRMNTPGTAQGNWRWRCPPGMLTDGLKDRLRQLTIACGRGTANESPEVGRLPG